MAKTGDDMPDAVVIGAGIIGISTALALQARGLKVRAIERTEIAAGASFGNAGGFAFSEIIPLATPGIIKKAPKWLLDPLGPLSVPPDYALRIAPWLLRFWRSSRNGPYRNAIAAQAALMRLSRAAAERQIADTGGQAFIRRTGQLALFEGASKFAANEPEWQIRKAHGIDYRALESIGEIAEIQLGIDPRFTHAAFTSDWYNVANPAKWVHRLANAFIEGGGEILYRPVEALRPAGDRVALQLSGGGTEYAAHAVLCAGPWSHRLAKTLGDDIPLESERGYNTTLPAGAFDLKTHLTFSDHGFAVSRIDDGVRVGGAVEFGGTDRKPDFRRARALLAKAENFLPDLKGTDGREWMGCRPSLPDSLPVIGRASASRRIVYAFGHGHLGLTQSAATGELVADLIAERKPAIDLHPFRADRF